jgi:hypothetical protein
VCPDGLVCRTIVEPDKEQKQNYVIVLHLDAVPASTTRLVAVSEGYRDVGDPEIAFDPARGFSALETGAMRSNGYVARSGSARTRVVYLVNAEKSFLRVVDEETGASTEVAAQPNWATGSDSTGVLALYFHPSVSRAVFLWSDSDPITTTGL